MKAADDPRDRLSGRQDVLSREEEAVLAAVRGIVDKIRAEAGALDLHRLIQAVTDTGATLHGAISEQVAVEFIKGRIRFCLRVTDSGIDIEFPGGS